jgi:ubiquinone/menaquinone biosynthesis C-methylase UbiE
VNKIKWNSKGYEKFDEEGAASYDTIANEVFAPIYPVLADRIVKWSGITSGVAIDIGTGPGNLAIALAKITDLSVCAMDFAVPIVERARRHIAQADVADRVIPIAGDVHRIPFADQSVTLVASRGSTRFWRNKPLAMREIRRILKTGGKCFIGGGLGSKDLADQISQAMAKHSGPGWKDKPRMDSKKTKANQWSAIMEKACIAMYEIIDDDSGFWVCFTKGE